MKNKKQIKKLKLEVENLRNDFCKSYEQQNISFKKDIIELEADCAQKIYELTLKVNDVVEQSKIKNNLENRLQIKLVSPSLLDTFDR